MLAGFQERLEKQGIRHPTVVWLCTRLVDPEVVRLDRLKAVTSEAAAPRPGAAADI